MGYFGALSNGTAVEMERCFDIIVSVTFFFNFPLLFWFCCALMAGGGGFP